MSRMPVCEPSQESSDDLKTRPKHEENDLCHYTAGEAENPEHNPLCDEREERNWFRSWLRESEDTSAWWLLFFVFLFNTLAGMFASMFGILLVEYSIHFDASIAVLAVIPALQMAAIAIGGIIMSGPVDRYGCSRVAFAGAVITFLGMSTASLGNTVPFLYITQGLVAGFGFSISQLCGPVIVQQHFTRNRPLACGLAYLGYSLGNCITPLLCKVLIKHYGWRGTLLILGGILAHKAPLSLTFRQPHRNNSRSKDSQIEERRSEKGCVQALRSIFDFSLFKNMSFTLFNVSLFLQSFYCIGYLTFTPNRAVLHGMGLTSAAFLSTSTFISSTCTRIVVTFISNMSCVSHPVQYSLGVAFGVVSVVVTLTVPTFTGALLGSILCGVTMGMCNSIESVIMLEVAGLDNLSRSIGISNLVFGVSSMIASPICGLLYDVTGSYDIPFAVTGCAAGLSSIAVAYIHCLRPKDQLKAGNMSNTVGLERNTDKALNGSWNSLPL